MRLPKEYKSLHDDGVSFPPAFGSRAEWDRRHQEIMDASAKLSAEKYANDAEPDSHVYGGSIVALEPPEDFDFEEEEFIAPPAPVVVVEEDLLLVMPGLCGRCKASAPWRDSLPGFCRVCHTVDWAQRLCRDSFLVLDTETTGVNTSTAEILSIGILDGTGAVVLESFVRPKSPINEAGPACLVNGIKNAHVRRAPSFADLYPSLCQLLDGQRVVIYNAAYDTRMLEVECERMGAAPFEFRPECAMEAVARFIGVRHGAGYKPMNLTKACQHFSVTQDGAHGAVVDCRSTLGVIKALAAYSVEGS